LFLLGQPVTKKRRTPSKLGNFSKMRIADFTGKKEEPRWAILEKKGRRELCVEKSRLGRGDRARHLDEGSGEQPRWKGEEVAGSTHGGGYKEHPGTRPYRANLGGPSPYYYGWSTVSQGIKKNRRTTSLPEGALNSPFEKGLLQSRNDAAREHSS